jgi:hypothetical protein
MQEDGYGRKSLNLLLWIVLSSKMQTSLNNDDESNLIEDKSLVDAVLARPSVIFIGMCQPRAFGLFQKYLQLLRRSKSLYLSMSLMRPAA